ncbi:cytosine-purine permease [Panaeolus papilionaceus]|nr:cytosine-purine permease [Panaeolus papilionaceus]
MELKFLKNSYWSLEREVSRFGPSSAWSNKDMDPVPPEKRTWSTWDYCFYWISDATNAAVWQLASSMIAIGLSWKQAIPAIAVGSAIIASVIVLNGTAGARLHVAFPVLNRSSFGFWLSYFSVVSRVVLSMFWFGIQTFVGSECIYQMLKAIWPSVARIPNRLSEGSNITTVDMMCYFLFWIIQLSLMFLSPHKIRYFFTLKGTLVPIAWMSMLIWALVKVPTSQSLGKSHSMLSGATMSWAWLGSMNSALGIYATLSVNIPDFTRYAKTERAQYIQLLIIPVAFTMIGFIGITVTAAGEVLYGDVLWDPLRLIDRWDNRAAAFFASASFLIATLGSNISANSLSAANDMTVLFPKYINIRRGQILCAIIGGWALCPWEILASAPGFLSFMSGYTVFLGPFAGIMVADYWVVHRCKVDVPAMYEPMGRYRYWKGINWRAAVALACSITPTLPGLINDINRNIFVGNASFLFNIAWLYGFFTSFAIYTPLSLYFPARETFLDKAILADDIPPSDSGSESEISDEKNDPASEVIMTA